MALHEPISVEGACSVGGRLQGEGNLFLQNQVSRDEAVLGFFLSALNEAQTQGKAERGAPSTVV
jgi:hypothetical protein